MIGKVISVMFLSREVAHREHLKSSSYAQHMALGEFYEAVVEQADCLAEVYQGMGTLIDDIPYLEHDGEGNIVTVLKKHLTLLQRYRAKCTADSKAMMAVFDNIESLYLGTLYKLKFLK